MSAGEMPMGLSLLVCDTIIEDRLTTKKSLVGLFDRVQVSNLPCIHPEMCVFIALTGGHGTYPCEVVCKHTDGKTMAFYAKGTVEFKDPCQVVDLVFRMKNVRFQKEGTYWLNFIADGVPVMMRQITITKHQSKPNGDRSQK